jgi:hypothetical protein
VLEEEHPEEHYKEAEEMGMELQNTHNHTMISRKETHKTYESEKRTENSENRKISSSENKQNSSGGNGSNTEGYNISSIENKRTVKHKKSYGILFIYFPIINNREQFFSRI